MEACRNRNGNGTERYEAALPQRTVADSPANVLRDTVDQEPEAGLDPKETDTTGSHAPREGDVAGGKAAKV